MPRSPELVACAKTVIADYSRDVVEVVEMRRIDHLVLCDGCLQAIRFVRDPRANANANAALLRSGTTMPKPMYLGPRSTKRRAIGNSPTAATCAASAPSMM